MDIYSFKPYLNGRLELPWNCVPCKNQNDAINKAKVFKDKYHFDFVTVYKHITQV